MSLLGRVLPDAAHNTRVRLLEGTTALKIIEHFSR